MKHITVKVDDGLHAEIKRFAKQHGLTIEGYTRSALINMTMSDADFEYDQEEFERKQKEYEEELNAE